jgi:hypothetical protein
MAGASFDESAQRGGQEAVNRQLRCHLSVPLQLPLSSLRRIQCSMAMHADSRYGRLIDRQAQDRYDKRLQGAADSIQSMME